MRTETRDAATYADQSKHCQRSKERVVDWDHEREAEKRTELLQSLTDAVKNSGVPATQAPEIADAIFDSFISTTPPEAKRYVTHLIVLGPMGDGGGQSTKAGNIKLNIGKLLEAVASGVLTAAGAVQLPITAPLAALVIWCSLWRTAQVPISEADGAVLYTMWVQKNADRDVHEAGLLERCNELLKKYEKHPITARSLQQSLTSLAKIEAIEASPRGAGMWWLREWVRVTYH